MPGAIEIMDALALEAAKAAVKGSRLAGRSGVRLNSADSPRVLRREATCSSLRP